MKIRRKDAAVRRIAARSMHTNRTRNLFAALAILLTTFMISTVFSIGLSFAENYQATQVRLNGTTASIFLNNPSASQTQQIAASDQLEAVGTQISVGSTTQKTRDGKPTKHRSFILRSNGMGAAYHACCWRDPWQLSGRIG